MNAKEYLSQAWLLEKQVDSKLQQIAALRSSAEGLNQCIEAEPVSHSRNVSAMQDTVNKIVEAEIELNEEIVHLVDLKREIKEVINQVRNVTYKLILEKRHLSFKKWEEIAEDLGYTARWAQIRYGEALEKVEEILEGKDVG